jgi:hypothetical protein
MARKTAQLNLRISPKLKRDAAKAAAADHRPLGSLVSVLLDRHCKEQTSTGDSQPSKRSNK